MSEEQGRDRHVRIPIRFLGDGRPEYYYGGSLPSFEPGTVAELVVPETAVVDPDEVERLRRTPSVELVPGGTAVYFEVRRDGLPPTVASHLQPGPEATEVLAVELREPVRLRLRGSRPARLEDARCWIPALGREVEGLEEAFRALADAMEMPRRPRPEEVLRRGYVRTGTGWRSLDEACRDREAAYDMRLSAIGARVLGLLPSRVAGLLQVCWLGDLESGQALSEALRDYRRRVHDLPSRAEVADLELADGLVEQCLELVRAVADEAPETERRLVQATVTYLIRDDDEECDSQSPVGFMDDALVVRTVAAVMSGSA